MQFTHVSRRLAALVVAGSLAACGGGGGGGSHIVPAAGTGAGSTTSTSSALTSTLVAQPKFSSATKLGPATSVDSLVMHVVVNLRNASGLANYAAGVSNPQDGRYRQFLTASQIGDQFGATTNDYNVVGQYLASYGLKVLGWPQRLGLTVAGSRSNFETALGTTFSLYRSAEGHTLVAPTGAIHFAKPLPVEGIADAIFDPKAKHTQFVQGASGGPQSNSTGGVSPQQVATAFDFTGAYNAGFTGAGITIGIVGTGGIDTHDFTAFKSQYGWPGTGTLAEVAVGSGAAANVYSGGGSALGITGGSPTATPPAVTAPCTTATSTQPSTTCNPEDFEAQIDTEQASLAPAANISFYLAYVPHECYNPADSTCTTDPNFGGPNTYQGLFESDDEIQQAIADNNGSAAGSGAAGPDVLSLSYGGPETLNNAYVTNGTTSAYDPSGFGVTEFAALATEGVAVFVSSGDDGAEGCAPYSLALENTSCVSYPAGDVSVTSVGGVTAPLNGAGQFIGPMTAWGTQTNSGGASGGGVASIIPLPAWETGAGVSAGGRNQPDLSLLGDPTTGIGVVANSSFAGSHVFTFGGTSVAAPEMAAMWALVLSACKVTPSCATASGGHPYRLGNAAPLFWKIYNNATQYPQTFYDVTFGTNALVGCQINGSCGSTPPPAPVGFVSGTGYDLVTGIGVPFARHLVKSVVGI